MAIDLMAIDTETTGLEVDEARIWEIGLASRRQGRVASVSALMNPQMPIPEDLIERFHIVPELQRKIYGSRTFPEKFPEIQRRVVEHLESGGVVCSFNGLSYDAPLLAAECQRHGLEPLPLTDENHLDALVWVREGMPKIPKKKLDIVAPMMKIPMPAPHRAWCDAAATLQIMERILAQVNKPLPVLIEMQRRSKQLQDDDFAVFSYWMRRRNGQIYVNCGRNCGTPIEKVSAYWWQWVLTCHNKWERYIAGDLPEPVHGPSGKATEERPPEPVPDAVLALALARAPRGRRR